MDWDREHIFYNPLFTKENGETFKITTYFEKNSFFKLEQFLVEKAKATRKLPFDKKIVDLFDKIKLDPLVKKEDIFVTKNGDEVKFSQVTQRQLYEEALMEIYGDHHSQYKWLTKLQTSIIWEDVWATVHNFLSSNETKTSVWKQLHLNFYTQYKYNQWHKTQDICPLCHKIPEDIYHIILNCEFTNKLWDELEPILNELHEEPISIEEKALGIVKKNPTTGILLRNWLTYFLRGRIMREERKAFHLQNRPNIENFKKSFNQKFHTEIQLKYLRYQNENRLQVFEKFLTYKEILGTKTDGEDYMITQIFN